MPAPIRKSTRFGKRNSARPRALPPGRGPTVAANPHRRLARPYKYLGDARLSSRVVPRYQLEIAVTALVGALAKCHHFCAVQHKYAQDLVK